MVEDTKQGDWRGPFGIAGGEVSAGIEGKAAANINPCRPCGRVVDDSL